MYSKLGFSFTFMPIQKHGVRFYMEKFQKIVVEEWGSKHSKKNFVAHIKVERRVLEREEIQRGVEEFYEGSFRKESWSRLHMNGMELNSILT